MHYLTILLLMASLNSWSEERITVGNFSSGKYDQWEEKVFKGKTQYKIVVDENKGKVLRAESHAGASGLVREIAIDLTKTPILNWSWRINKTLEHLDERTKAGDDYVARLYIVVSGGFAFWNTKSLNYVWASKMPIGSTWPNAYAGENVIMIALQSGNSIAGRWQQQKRNIRSDLKAYFGKDIKTIDAVAIMTDTDNSGQQASAWYGDVFFTSK